MSRRRAARPAAKIQLFTFLDVLTCTVGCLVLILALFARQGLNAARKAEQEQPGGPTLSVDRAGLEWQISQLKESRSQTEAQLSAARLELSHIEDHLRRLREQHQRLTAAEQEMAQSGQRDATQLEATAAELTALKQQVADAEQRAAAAEQAARHKSVSYSVVPYEGPNQTRRHPIYIECRDDAVVLQPEGIVLGEHDFDGSLGPGNPLAAALRAAREYLVARQPNDVAGKEDPYPMLLVRPEGTEAYYVARTALNSWASDFGYELVGDDWKLKYPPPDPQLSALLARVVAEARQRQEQFRKSMPSYLAGGDRVVYRASPSGGFVKEFIPGGHGPGGGGRDSRGGGRSRFGGSRGGRGADRDGQLARGGSGPGSNRDGSADGADDGDASTAGRYPGNFSGTSAGGPGGVSGGAVPGFGSYAMTGAPGSITGSADGGGAPGSPGSTTAGAIGAAAGGPGDMAMAGGGTLGPRYGAMNGSPGADSYGGSAGAPGTGATDGSRPGLAAGSMVDSSGGATGGSTPGATAGAARWSPDGSMAGTAMASAAAATTGSKYGSTSGSPDPKSIAGSPGTAGADSRSADSLGRSAADSTTNSAFGSAAGGASRKPASGTNSQGGSATGSPNDSLTGSAGLSGSQAQMAASSDSASGQGGTPSFTVGGSPQSSHKRSMAKGRGRDWGLPESTHRAVPVTRPVLVECDVDRLVILSEDGRRAEKEVRWGPRTEDSIDEFVAGLWQHMKGWGMAGNNLYWKPILSVDVRPGSAARYAELRALLEDSGLEVHERQLQQAAAARPTPTRMQR